MAQNDVKVNKPRCLDQLTNSSLLTGPKVAIAATSQALSVIDPVNNFVQLLVVTSGQFIGLRTQLENRVSGSQRTIKQNISTISCRIILVYKEILMILFVLSENIIVPRDVD